MNVSTAILPETRSTDAHTVDAPAPWETEAFVLRAAGRNQLRDAARALASWLSRNSDVPVSDLAYSLALELEPGGNRLTVVASSGDDLRAKLIRAADRLADPKVRHIRDVQGVYYFDQPLYAPGAVAVLMPGEGAQSVGMLGELCQHFPEVGAGFHWCDRVAVEVGRPEESLRALIFPPVDVSAAGRAAAEAKLRQLGPSIFSVLVADLAINELLKNLQLPVAAYAGHSAGELAALYAAGAIPDGANSSRQLVAIMDLMQEQEEAAGGPETLLLATGAGKATIAEIVAQERLPDVFVAMDNCPHQSIVVGAAAGVRAVESVLHERGILCERLGLRRPYHTPLFAPWLGPFYDLFGRMPIQEPHTPVYCATSGGRFPQGVDAIRQLTVDNWKSPVQFPRTIEAMYADGVRLFVESGPRGNLSAFVEDILRGRPFAALPIDTPRRSGTTQLNHVVAQLLAHHVPLNVGHLFAYRNVEQVHWRKQGGPNPPTPFPSREGGARGSAVSDNGTPSCSPPRFGEGTGEGLTGETMMHYLGVMEQFLDVQRDVLTAWLRNGASPGSNGPEGGEGRLAGLDDLLSPGAVPGTEHPEPEVPSILIDEIVHLVPGREVVVRRRLDLAEDRYATHHTIGGRSASHVDPDQHGLPVLPMTFSLELMAACACLLLPGRVVTAFRDIRLMRWLPFEAEPITIEVTATVQPTEPPTVQAVIRDLCAGKAAAQAVVEVAEAYPEPPVWGAFPLTNARPCKATLADLYRNFFHGPLFQGMHTLERLGDEGIEGTIVVLPRDRWFASTPEPRLVTDPVLADVVMHVIGVWHLEQPDWSGRILLPIGVKRFEFYGPPPPAGSVLRVRATTDETSTRHVVHSVEAADPDGRVWCRLAGAGYWRFYLPFGHVNFFGPKDEYFLSRPVPEALPPSPSASRCWVLEFPTDLLTQPVLRTAGARMTLTPRELVEFERLHKERPDAAVNAWLFGRIVGKDAVRSLRTERYGDKMFPADIELSWDGHSPPRAAPREPGHPGAMPHLSIAHREGRAVAAAAFHPYVGVALEKIGDDVGAARRNAARAAVAMALGGRPNGPARDGQISASAVSWDCELLCSPPGFDEGPAGLDFLVSLPTELAATYPDLVGPLLVRTLRWGECIVATTFCEVAPA